MPTIIPKGYYCPKCKKEIKKKICECGANAKPVPPYTVRFRWINEDGIEEHKRLTGTPPWTTQSAAQKDMNNGLQSIRGIDELCRQTLPIFRRFSKSINNIYSIRLKNPLTL